MSSLNPSQSSCLPSSQYRELIPLLKYTHGSRVMWTTSSNAFAHGFSLDDWQLTETQQPYELVKFETEMLAAILDEAAVQNSDSIRHIIMHPGISRTEISAKLTGAVLRMLQVQISYLVRFVSSNYQIVPLMDVGAFRWLEIPYD